jgi:hypothetical protein
VADPYRDPDPEACRAFAERVEARRAKERARLNAQRRARTFKMEQANDIDWQIVGVGFLVMLALGWAAFWFAVAYVR